MKIFKKVSKSVNDMFTHSLIPKLLIEKSLPAQSTELSGTLILTAKINATVTSIHYIIRETLEKSHGNDIGVKGYILGEYINKETFTVETIAPQQINFTVPYDIQKGSLGDKEIYSGDMALFNKASDGAKKASRKYTLEATITLDGEEKDITTKTTINFM